MPRTGRPSRAPATTAVHHRCETGDGAAAQVVAVGEPTRQDDGVDTLEVGRPVPESDGLTAGQPDGAQGVPVVEGAREGDDSDAWAHSALTT